MRFYVPEWDDAVDAQYDFEHDELSELDRQERNLNYIWDIFDRETTPIDGVLISREQVETSDQKFDRLTTHGVYNDGVLSVPEWLPTISDCGAWGYKSLPFPPYGNGEMLEFYESLGVTIGVTIDHLVLGSGKNMGRLYLDKRAFGDGITQAGLPDVVTDAVDVMVDEWPEEWPPYVEAYEPSIRTDAEGDVKSFSQADFEGDIEAILSRLESDPRAVYREDDKQFRYDLTLRNAREMYDLYDGGKYPFRLMVAIQGWDTESYRAAASDVLEMGYDYLGIGGVAGSPIHDVRKIVSGVGKTIKTFERTHETRIDSHVFGFAKTEAFETIGRSGMTSFDSASMLRSAWTGGENYRLDTETRYDAIRIRYPSPGDDLSESIEKSLRGREALVALRAYGANESIVDALAEWEDIVTPILDATREFLQTHRHDDCYNGSRLRDVESNFRSEFSHARELQASFSGDFRREIVRLLREDTPADPMPFEAYEELLQTAAERLEAFCPMRVELERTEPAPPLEQVWTVVSEYALWIGDEDLLDAYYETLAARPWEQCECQICGDNGDSANGHGIEVCIFRGNDRNRRRGFHNTKRFYDQFAEALPKILVATRGTVGLMRSGTVEEYLAQEHPEFWTQVHDLPVAEVGVFDADGFREWWQEAPDSISFAPNRITQNLSQQTERYEQLFVHSPEKGLSDDTSEAIEANGCTVTEFEDSGDLREAVLEACGENYVASSDFLPHPPELGTANGLDVLIIDQCSGLKNTPEAAPVFDAQETLEHSREELLSRENVPGIEARDLYAGRQQESVTNAVRQLRRAHNVDRYFISAGFGLVAEDQRLPPYEVTFSSMKVDEIRERSNRLHIKEDVQRLIQDSTYDVVFFTLGKDYYVSIDIDEMVREVPPGQIGVVFNRELVGEQYDNVVSVSARTEDAKNHGTIVIGLKGTYMENFARRIDSVETLTPELIEDLCRRVDEGPKQSGLGVNDDLDSKENDTDRRPPESPESGECGPEAVYEALVRLSEASPSSPRDIGFDEAKPLLRAFGLEDATVSHRDHRSYLVQPQRTTGREFVLQLGMAMPVEELIEGPVRPGHTGLGYFSDIVEIEGRFDDLEDPVILSIDSHELAVYGQEYKRLVYLHQRDGEWDKTPMQTPLTMEIARELYDFFGAEPTTASQANLESF